jgi:hypothetical protein
MQMDFTVGIRLPLVVEFQAAGALRAAVFEEVGMLLRDTKQEAPAFARITPR